MVKYEFKKFPILAVIFTLIGLVLGVAAISVSLVVKPNSGSVAFLALLEIVSAVLVLAGLTTGKVILLRVISIILHIAIVITAFVLTIVKFTDKDVFLFAISLLMLITSVLELIYFLTFRNPRIKKMYFVSGHCFSGLGVVYGIVYMVTNIVEHVKVSLPLTYNYYFLIFAFAFVSVLPVAIYRALVETEVDTSTPEVEVIDNE